MQRITSVYIRETQSTEKVTITSLDKPKISNSMKEKWQGIINLMAKILKVPSGLLMQITDDSMKVFLKSQNKKNPYPEGGSDSLGHGLYCETVIGTNDELHIGNALHCEKWNDNPDVELNMISYYGLPVKWPDNEFFGTICVLDNKTNTFLDEYKDLVKEFRNIIETDLELLLFREKLKYYADTDELTSLNNRRKIKQLLINEFNRSTRLNQPFSIAIMDINKFKKINDTYGHLIGDEVLKVFAKAVNSRIRSCDNFGRWGGDEFLLICPGTCTDIIMNLISEMEENILNEMNKIAKTMGICYGCSEYLKSDKSYHNILKRADDNLFKHKKDFYEEYHLQ